MWQAWTNSILGIWLFIAAFLSFSPTGNLWDNLIVGVVVAIAGFAMINKKSWQGWLSGILGVWLIIAAFIPGLQMHLANAWNDAIVGLLLLIAGGMAMQDTQDHSGHQMAH